MNIIKLLSLLILIAAINVSAAEWGYSGDIGPEFWGDLSEDFITCKVGMKQSPVDLSSFEIDDDDDDDDEDLATLKHMFNPTNLDVLNNGHTIEVEVHNASYTKTENGKQRLLQYHFHSPSEHTVNGVPYPLEAHFVHTDNSGVLSVVGVFFEIGEENKALADILRVAPRSEGHVSVEDEFIDGNDVLGGKKTKNYYRLDGSLTTPRCTEGVRWYVSKDVQTLSYEQYENFQDLFHGGNARPTQMLNGRTIRVSESD